VCLSLFLSLGEGDGRRKTRVKFFPFFCNSRKDAEKMCSLLFFLFFFNHQPDLTRNPIEGFSAGLVDDSNVLQWQVTIMGPPDTLYEGGFFTATMTFPRDYPNKPPDVKFKSEIWHPNVYPDGRVCISILHDAGDDPMGYECASERWSPVQTVETIMLSIISMLSSPNDESPANIDAAKMFREDYAAFKKRVARCVRKSQEECF
jgi:ubiquitin-conjugating enzyme E2 G1